MANVVKDLGAVSAYALAVKYGYKGTEAEWVAAQEAARIAAETAAETANEAQEAAESAQSAAEASARAANGSAESASRAVSAAGNSANLAAKKAEEAQQSAKEAFNQAINASSDATQASIHASAAEQSANAAEASRQAAQAVLDSIPHDYSNLSKMADGVAIIAEASGEIISVHDGAVVDAVSLVSHIAPAADGSGWNTVNVHRTGRNLLYKTPADVVKITYTNKSGESKTIYGYDIRLPAGNYTARATYKADMSTSNMYIYILILDTSGSLVSAADERLVSGATVKPVDVSLAEGQRLIMYHGAGTTNVENATDRFSRVNMGIYLDGADTTYEEYAGETLIAELPETVYGGTLDWGTGVLTSTLDSTGNALSTPKEYLLTPQQLEMLYGCNAVWSDCGNTSLKYVADTKMYIDNKIAAIAAAIVNG